MTAQRRLDIAVLAILAIGAGCGLVYEYLLSHYAGRVLGAVEVAIFGVITVMILFMGIGSFLARKVSNPYLGFAWLEVLLALFGSTTVLFIGGLFAFSELLPNILMKTFSLTQDLRPIGGFIAFAQAAVTYSPYVFGALLGTMIGMEIPLIGDIRARIFDDQPQHNAGAIYGIDYIGAGFGAALWLAFMLAMEISLAAALTASVNLLIGVIFLILFRREFKKPVALIGAYFFTAIVIAQVYDKGATWSAVMEDLLYRDQVMFRVNTDHQRLVVTERMMDPAKPSVVSFFINGRLQFASNDEHIYHSMLTYPPLAAAARHDNVLIIGGGDGLALRDVLRWEPNKVTLLDLDASLVNLFRERVSDAIDNTRLLEINSHSFSDPRVEARFGDAFLNVDDLLKAGSLFDVIIVDLPDPSHPDLNKLYSSRFYAKLNTLLAGDGALSVQSSSPYHAKKTFISIGKTVHHAGFHHVDQYHTNVPSFGQWGWTIAVKNGRSARARIAALETLPVDDKWITKGLMLAAFEFEKGFFDKHEDVEVNRLGTMVVYRYHHNDWRKEMGIYQLEEGEEL
jgi:spermidine synthase